MLSQVFPTLVVAPRYIAGLITLGGLMQSAQAFQQMVGALSWAIDNLGKVADWRASAEYRQLTAKNLLIRFYLETSGAPQELKRFATAEA